VASGSQNNLDRSFADSENIDPPRFGRTASLRNHHQRFQSYWEWVRSNAKEKNLLLRAWWCYWGRCEGYSKPEECRCSLLGHKTNSNSWDNDNDRLSKYNSQAIYGGNVLSIPQA
jgi:hypothetical protein